MTPGVRRASSRRSETPILRPDEPRLCKLHLEGRDCIHHVWVCLPELATPCRYALGFRITIPGIFCRSHEAGRCPNSPG